MTPEIAAMIHGRMMAKTGEERFLVGVRMHEAARRMVMASFPAGIFSTSPAPIRSLLLLKDHGSPGTSFPNLPHVSPTEAWVAVQAAENPGVLTGELYFRESCMAAPDG